MPVPASTEDLIVVKIFQDTSLGRAFAIIIAFSLVAVAGLFWIIYFKEQMQGYMSWVAFLPYVNASLNSICTLLLILGLKAIKKKEYQKHMKLMFAAFAASAFFLISYVVYHTFHGDTKFLAEGFVRYIYFFILITHIVLSVGLVPLILGTFYLSLSGKFELHRKVARITFPIWLYVSVTGILIVALLKLFNT